MDKEKEYTIRKLIDEIRAMLKPDTEQEIDDWCESVEARLTALEKRVSMINAFQVMKEAEENERRKAREKPLHACRIHRKRA